MGCNLMCFVPAEGRTVASCCAVRWQVDRRLSGTCCHRAQGDTVRDRLGFAKCPNKSIITDWRTYWPNFSATKQKATILCRVSPASVQHCGLGETSGPSMWDQPASPVERKLGTAVSARD
jgi:hypothetical protein